MVSSMNVLPLVVIRQTRSAQPFVSPYAASRSSESLDGPLRFTNSLCRLRAQRPALDRRKVHHYGSLDAVQYALPACWAR